MRNRLGQPFFTASELKEKLESTKPMDILSAANYIAGVLDGYHFGIAFSHFINPENKHLDLICLPDGTTLEQISAVVKKYILDNPKDWQEPANSEVIYAMTNTWPCKK